LARTGTYLRNGTAFIIPVPARRVIDGDDHETTLDDAGLPHLADL
jgi:hypothetical protein